MRQIEGYEPVGTAVLEDRTRRVEERMRQLETRLAALATVVDALTARLEESTPAPVREHPPSRGAGTRAERGTRVKVGDRIVIEPGAAPSKRRIGIVTGLRHPDGSPPYTVRWLDTERESLFFPGVTARIEPMPSHGEVEAPRLPAPR